MDQKEKNKRTSVSGKIINNMYLYKPDLAAFVKRRHNDVDQLL